METRLISANELADLMERDEDHFFDLKGKDIQPGKLQETFVAFANADGGDIFIGIEDKKYTKDRLRPFLSKEEANPICVLLLENTQPSVENVSVEFLEVESKGYILHISIPKSPKVHYTSSQECYVRLNAGKVKIKGDKVTSLAYSKGSMPYERQAVTTTELEEIINSPILKDYMARIRSNLEPEVFLKKQKMIVTKDGEKHPTVAAVLLFSEEPQVSIDTRCAIKVYRLRTTEADYKREYLSEMPFTVNGSIEQLILGSLQKVEELLDGVTYYEGDRLVRLKYPVDAIKEVLVNSVVHRDYSLNDDIHIRIFDNRIEIVSPGKLPGYMTIKNIYSDRFSRNPSLVRMLHRLPNPLNHDIGEGLDTARNELKKAGLVEPEFSEQESSFTVKIRHQRIASIEDVILEYIEQRPDAVLTNKLVRDLSGEDDINKVKKALQKLRSDGKIQLLDEKATAFNYKYVVAQALRK